MATTKVDVNLIGATGTPGSGNFLRGDGSWQAAGGGSLTLIATQNITSTAGTVEFTSGITADYDEYFLSWSGWVPSTGTSIKCRIDATTDGGSNWLTSGWLAGSSSADTQSHVCNYHTYMAGTTSGDQFAGWCRVYKPMDATVKTLFMSESIWLRGGTGLHRNYTGTADYGGNAYNTAVALNGFRFYSDGASVAKGRFSIHAISNS